jgi:hypothetical protein
MNDEFLKGSRRGILGVLFQHFFWKNRIKPQRIFVRVASGSAQIRTEYLTNVNLQCYLYAILLS